MSVRLPRRSRAATGVAGVVLAALAAAGCSRQPGTAPQASVAACTEFGITAIRQHVTVTSLPAACRGLTRAQVNFAIGTALRSAAVGAGGKVRQRERVARVGHYLQSLVRAVPQQRSQPPVPGPAAGQASRATLGLTALATWLVTVVLGLAMLAKWIARGGRRARPPALNFAHLSLAIAGLLGWIAYLATGIIGVAWAACAVLPLVAGLGMTLVFLSPSPSPAAAVTARAGTVSVPAGAHRPARRAPVFLVAAHIGLATLTILFAFLTVIGAG
jgi:hypothetical protein